MSLPGTDSPYPVGALVRDSGLLALRRQEIERGLQLAAPGGGGENRHAVLIGDPHSGRTSVLTEISRRAAEERGRLVVRLRGGDGIAVARAELVRHLLTAIAETLSTASGLHADWYRAWRDRVYLQTTTPAGQDDLLSSALILAADSNADIDRAVLERDLGALAGLARESGFEGIMVCIDDASPLTEDVGLIEEIVDVFDSADFYSLLITGLPAVAGHFNEAASRCLERLEPVWLEPFYGPPKILAALQGPLPPDCEYLKSGDLNFVLDLLNLTAGNPHELMVVADHLWLSCERGEQDTYALTPRLLDRVIPNLALRTGEGDALRDGAQAIECLPEEQVPGALELASLSRLTVHEVAVNRLLKDPSGRKIPAGRKSGDITEHLNQEEERVKADLMDLEANGVVTVHPDGESFAIVGGRPAAVLLKYKARARIGDSSERAFGQKFLHVVGQPLTQKLMRKAREAVSDAAALGFTIALSDRGIGSRSPRPAIRSLSASDDVSRFSRCEAEVMPWGVEASKKIAELVASDEVRVALVCSSVNYGRGELEFMELWQVPAEISDASVSEALQETIENWRPLIEATGLSWRGVDSAVVSGASARKALGVLRPFAAIEAVHQTFKAWREGVDADGLERAIRTCAESIEVIRAGDQTDLERGGELSGSLSRLGFLESLDDARLGEARAALEEAQHIGQADGWVTDWNLANVLAREGDMVAALKRLDKVEASSDLKSWASLLFYIPERAPGNCLLDVRRGGVKALLALQRAVIEDDVAAREVAVELARKSGDEGAALAADWVEQAGAQLALQTRAV
ncbi:MAG: hypothetical protein ACJ75T_00140 [Solirubrobacterales bacterium]